MLALLTSAAITFVPMYATPTAAQLPVMLARIAGVRVREPPAQWLGDYIAPGNAAAIGRWLEERPARDARAFVISADMLAYGGLDASRVPGGITRAQAIARLQVLRDLRALHPRAWIAAFGTIMRLEPTAVTAVGEAANYSPIAQYPTWQYIWEYARLHDPPLPGERARATHLRAIIGPSVLAAYVQTRARNRDVDLAALGLVADGTLNRIVIGQDDAGPVGLHVNDVRALRDEVARLQIADRASIEPGADELGPALLAHAMVRRIGWTPHIAVQYSSPTGARTQDLLEFAPIDVTIGDLIRLCGGVRDDARPDITLYVRVTGTDAAQDARLLREMDASVRAGRSTAFVDLTFLTGSYDAQAAYALALVSSGVAGLLDAYAAWNTDANSVGIALAEAVAVGVGRRTARYDPIAHAEFMLDRYFDGYLYHTHVRPVVNADLAARGVSEHYWLAPDEWSYAQARVRALMAAPAQAFARCVYPQYRVASLDFTLPWPRTFDIRSNVRLLPARRPSGRSVYVGRPACRSPFSPVD